jgi:peptidoglycan/LPS O-acetylase OafA/YrhL
MKSGESEKVRSSRFDNLDAIRGVACLMVCLFHFTNSDPDFPKSHYLRDLFEHGNLGVQIFFVISGFIIPISMGKSNYEWGNVWRFLLKRGVRLYPPYILALLVALLSAGVATLLPGG